MRCRIGLCAPVAVLWAVAGLPQVWGQNNPPPAPATNRAAPNAEHEALKVEAENAYQQSDFPKCIELTGKVLAQNPKDHVALYLRASARVELGQLQRNAKEIRAGVEDAREAMKQGGTEQINYYLPYFYGMTGLAQLENRKEHAEVVINFVATLLKRPGLKAEEQANLRYQRANALMFLNQYESAAKDFDAAATLVTSHLGARLGLADSYVRSQKPDKAEAAFTAAVESAPNNPLVYNNRGMFYQQTGKAQSAIADFTRAVELDGTFAIALTNRGFTLLGQGNAQEAEGDFTAAIKVDPMQPLVYSLRGTSRLSQGNAAGAIEDYGQVLKFDSRNPIAHADLGFAKYFGGDWPGATAAFEQALTIDKKLTYLNPWRYWSLVKAQQGAVANEKLQAVLSKPAKDRDWGDALVSFLAGQLDEAGLFKAAEVKPGALREAQLCEAHYFIAERKAATGDAAGAKAGYDAALASKQSHLSAYRGSQFALNAFR